jgi:adenine-specific DNA methylase
VNQLRLLDPDDPSAIEAAHESQRPSSFRTIHYLGSKLRLLGFIEGVINTVDSSSCGVCDLFSGSGSVTQRLSSQRRIIAVDIQEYSRVICSALLSPPPARAKVDDYLASVFGSIASAEEVDYSLWGDLIDLEQSLLSSDHRSDLDGLCSFLEECSIYNRLSNLSSPCDSRLGAAIERVLVSIASNEKQSWLITQYFGGVFFSFQQAVVLDTILSRIRFAPEEIKPVLLASLISTASDLVNTVGKQFAQPISPRTSSGAPKSGLLSQVRRDRIKDATTSYLSWVAKYLTVMPCRKPHMSLKMDYYEALSTLPDDVKIIYADPPYTRDHYSRFYHVLETIALNDYPAVTRSNLGRGKRLSKGMYRQDRHQSPFCIKSQAPREFERMFQKVAKTDRTLVLSYSPFNRAKGAHPRVMTVESLLSMAKSHFSHVEALSAGSFSHSKLNHTRLHLSSETDAELVIVMSNK